MAAFVPMSLEVALFDQAPGKISGSPNIRPVTEMIQGEGHISADPNRKSV
jgi:hypothetical protein